MLGQHAKKPSAQGARSILHRGLTSYIFLWFLRNGLLLKRALKSGGHHPEKFKMAAKFRAILRLSGVWVPLCTCWDKILSKCIEAFTPLTTTNPRYAFFVEWALCDRGVAHFQDRRSCEDHSKPKNQTKAGSSDRYVQHKHVKNIFEKQWKNKYLVLNNITFSRFVQFGFQFQKATINVHNSLEHLKSIQYHCISNPNPNSNHIHLNFYIP